MTVLNEVWLQLPVMKMGGPSQKMARVEINWSICTDLPFL